MDYSLGETIKSIKLTQWALQNRKNAVSSIGKTVIIPVTSSNIKAEELALMERFTKLLSLDISEVNNLGFANYQGLVFKRHSPCYFCLYGEDNQMGLVIGGEDAESGYTATFIPCDVSVDYDGETPVSTYVLGGRRKIMLKEAVDQNNDSTGKVYLKMESANGRDSFSFPLLLTKEAYNNLDEVFAEWDSGTFHNCLKNFGDRANGSYGDFNNMFSAAFQQGTFPSDGVILFLKNGKMSRREPDAQYKDGITSSEWVLIGSSHPDLTVARYRKANPTDAHKTAEFTVMSEFNILNFTKASQPTQFLMNEKIELYSNYALLLVCGVNSSTNNVMHTPSHAFISNPDDFENIDTSPYPYLEDLISKHVAITPVQSQAQLMPAKNQPIEETDYEEAKSDFDNSYPNVHKAVPSGNQRQSLATNGRASTVKAKTAKAAEMAAKIDDF